jgi:hypothetical protein
MSMTAEGEISCKADPVPHGEAMRAAVDTATTRRQQRHPQVKLAQLPCGHAIALSGQGAGRTHHLFR